MSTRLMSTMGGTATFHNASRAMLRRGLPVPPTARDALSSRAARPLPPTASILRARPMLQHQFAKGKERGGLPTGITVAATVVMAAAALVSSRREDGDVPAVLAAEAYSLPIGGTSPQVVSKFPGCVRGWGGTHPALSPSSRGSRCACCCWISPFGRA